MCGCIRQLSRAIGNKEALIQRSGRGPNIIGRLREDASIDEAQVELDGIWNRLKVAYPELRIPTQTQGFN